MARVYACIVRAARPVPQTAARRSVTDDTRPLPPQEASRPASRPRPGCGRSSPGRRGATQTCRSRNSRRAHRRASTPLPRSAPHSRSSGPAPPARLQPASSPPPARLRPARGLHKASAAQPVRISLRPARARSRAQARAATARLARPASAQCTAHSRLQRKKQPKGPRRRQPAATMACFCACGSPCTAVAAAPRGDAGRGARDARCAVRCGHGAWRRTAAPRLRAVSRSRAACGVGPPARARAPPRGSGPIRTAAGS
jgi:hypothetical protein